LQEAASIVDSIGDRETCKKLSQAALDVGCFGLAQIGLRKADDTEGLALFHLISSESNKLRKQLCGVFL
jgi:hypothetical protein